MGRKYQLRKENCVMISAAHYEDAMQEYEAILKNLEPGNVRAVNIKAKAIQDTVDVLHQFGYDAGAKIFVDIMAKMYG